MPTSDDLSDQLSLTTKLAAQVERMAAASDRLEQSYQGQIDAVNKLASAIGQINPQNSAQNVEVLNKVLKDLMALMKDTGKSSEQTFQKLGKQAKETGDTFSKKLPKSVGVAVGALSGFAQGVRNIVALGKGVTGFFVGFVDGLVNVAASIVAIPFKVFSGLVDMAASSAGGMNELAQAIENLRKEFGALAGPTPKTIIDMSQSLKGFSDTGLSTWRVFGNLAKRIEDFTKLATEMGATFTALLPEFQKNGGALLAYQKGLGISDEAMKGVASQALSMGDTLADTLKTTTKYSLDMAKGFGLDAKVISRDMAKAIGDVKHFAGATIKELGEASTYARKLGLELDKITGTLDAFETFDTAAENVAKLSQSFGVTVDAFQLMEQQDPAKQIDMLRKSFADAGVDASQFNRQQLKLLSSTTGLDEATARQAFSMKNQGVGLDQIKRKGGEAEKKTLTQAQAMERLADAIERLVMGGGAMKGSFFDQFIDGIITGLQSSREFFGVMQNIRIALREVYMIGVQLGRALPKIIPDLGDLLRATKDFFDPKKFTTLFGGIKKSIEDFIRDPKANFTELMTNLRHNFFDFFDDEKEPGKKILASFKRIFVKLGKLAAEGIKWASDQVGVGLREIVDLIKDPSKLVQGAKGAAGELGFLQQLLVPFIDAFKHAWKAIEPAAWDLLTLVGHKLHDFLVSPRFTNLIKPALPVLAAVLFGPVFSRAILGAVVTNLAKSAVGMLTGGGGVGGVVKKAAASMTAKAGEGALGKLGMASKVAGGAGLIGAALAIGKGVDEYTDQVTSTLDRSSKVIGGAATGVIDALTLGLLPKDIKVWLANAFASVSDSIFSALGATFGAGYASSLKRYLASTLEVLGGIWSVLKNLFTGDQASFTKSVTELGLDVLRFVVSSVEFMLVQLPALVSKLAVEVLDVVAGIIVKVVAGTLGFIATGVDKVFGTSFADKVNGWADTVRGGLDTVTDKYVKASDESSKKISDATQSFNDTYLRTASDKARIAASASASIAQQANDAASKAADATKDGLVKVADNLQAVKDIKAQLGDKDFDVVGALQQIGDRLKGVSFDVISDVQAADMIKSTAGLKSLQGFVGDLQASFTGFADLGRSVQAIKKGAIAEAVMAVSAMVKVANELDMALSDGNVNKIDIKAKLERVAKAVGLGSKATYTVNPGKAVQVVVNLEVTMDVDKVEKVMILRKQSIIRDRLDFATSNPDAALPDTLSQYTPQSPPTVPSTGAGTQ